MLSRDCSSITRTTLAGSNSWNETSVVSIDLHSFSYYQRAHRNPLIIRTWQGFFTAPFSLLPAHFFFCILHLRPPSVDVPEPLAWCVFRGQRWVQPSAGSAVNASWKSTAIWRIEVQGVPCHLHPSAYHPSRLESPSQRGSLDFKNNFVSALTQNLGTSDLKGTKFSNPRKINRVGVGQFNPV